ncbi:MAG: hypothetical protein HYZ29_33860 [Myxococcales bacterium]|nr:hypothetical protein [Myxococcales bacterium]
MMGFVSVVLRSPAGAVALCLDPRARVQAARASLLLIVAGGVSFGAAAGSFRGAGQALLAALKLPSVTLLTLAIAGPAFVALASAIGQRWEYRSSLALMLAAGARSSLVLLALSPALGLAVDCGVSCETLRLLALAGYALAGLSGLTLLAVALGDAPGRVAALLAFVSVFAAVGVQSAWLFRPFLGDPRDATVPVFAHGRVEGGIFGALFERRP